MAHAELGLGGALWTFMLVILGLSVVLALFVVYHSARRVAKSAQRYGDRSLKFGIFQATFLVLLGFAQIPVIGTWFATPAALLVPVSIAVSVSYLLRIVYPKPAEDILEIADVLEDGRLS